MGTLHVTAVLLDLAEKVSVRDLRQFLDFVPLSFDLDEDLRMVRIDGSPAPCLAIHIQPPVDEEARIEGATSRKMGASVEHSQPRPSNLAEKK